MSEIYKQITEHPNYEISNLGNCRRLKSKRICKGRICPLGYWRVHLDGYNKRIHRLVAMAFLPNPNLYKDVDHRDRNPSNNNVNNLRWISKSNNLINRKTINNYGRGIEMSGHLYRVRMIVEKQRVCVGSFTTAFEARIRYQIYILKNNLNLDYIDTDDIHNIHI